MRLLVLGVAWRLALRKDRIWTLIYQQRNPYASYRRFETRRIHSLGIYSAKYISHYLCRARVARQTPICVACPQSSSRRVLYTLLLLLLLLLPLLLALHLHHGIRRS